MNPVRHIVLVAVKASTAPDSLAAALDGLSALPSTIPNILSHHVGRLLTADLLPAGLVDSTAGFTLVIDFLLSSADALRVYNEHPDHAKVGQELMPLVQNLVAVDVDMPGLDVAAFLRAQHAPHVHHLTLVRLREGVSRADIGSTLQKWGTLPTTVPELVWANVGYATDKLLFDGWQDISQGYSVVSDMVASDLPSVAAYTQSVSYQELAPYITKIMGAANSSRLAAVRVGGEWAGERYLTAHFLTVTRFLYLMLLCRMHYR